MGCHFAIPKKPSRLHLVNQQKYETKKPDSALRAGGCATPTGFALSAGVQANHALTFKPDHSLGADQIAMGASGGKGSRHSITEYYPGQSGSAFDLRDTNTA
jgi:hypothetical protein